MREKQKYNVMTEAEIWRFIDDAMAAGPLAGQTEDAEGTPDAFLDLPIIAGLEVLYGRALDEEIPEDLTAMIRVARQRSLIRRVF